jgi:hypothetical protein
LRGSVKLANLSVARNTTLNVRGHLTVRGRLNGHPSEGLLENIVLLVNSHSTLTFAYCDAVPVSEVVTFSAHSGY